MKRFSKKKRSRISSHEHQPGNKLQKKVLQFADPSSCTTRPNHHFRVSLQLRKPRRKHKAVSQMKRKDKSAVEYRPKSKDDPGTASHRKQPQARAHRPRYIVATPSSVSPEEPAPNHAERDQTLISASIFNASPPQTSTSLKQTPISTKCPEKQCSGMLTTHSTRIHPLRQERQGKTRTATQ